jgi:branched-subunit amino acid transport protein
VSTELVVLAVLMGAVTYPVRALPLLAPGVDRLPPRARLYLRLVGPAILASVGSANTLVGSTSAGAHELRVGVEVVAVLACVALVAWRRNLLLGLVVAVLVVAGGRAAGIG